MSSVLLISAVIASLAVGVYVAQGLSLLMFYVFRIHAQKAAAERALGAAKVEGLRTASN